MTLAQLSRKQCCHRIIVTGIQNSLTKYKEEALNSGIGFPPPTCLAQLNIFRHWEVFNLEYVTKYGNVILKLSKSKTF